MPKAAAMLITIRPKRSEFKRCLIASWRSFQQSFHVRIFPFFLSIFLFCGTPPPVTGKKNKLVLSIPSKTKARFWYQRGRALEIFPTYSKDAEACLSKAVINPSIIPSAKIRTRQRKIKVRKTNKQTNTGEAGSFARWSLELFGALFLEKERPSIG